MSGFGPTGSFPTASLPSAGGGPPPGTYTLTLAAGAYALTGVAATPHRPTGTYSIALVEGVYNLVGDIAGLTGPSPGTHTLAIAPGVFTLTPDNVVVVFNRKLNNLDAGVFRLTPDGNTEYDGYTLYSEVGTFTTAGASIAVTRPVRGLGNEPGFFQVTLTGIAGVGRRIILEDHGAFAYTGLPITDHYGFGISLLAGGFNLSGVATGFRRNPKIHADPAFYAMVGDGWNRLRAYRKVFLIQGTYDTNFFSQSFHLGYGATLVSATFGLTGLADTLKATRKLIEVAGTYTMVAEPATFGATKGLRLVSGTFSLPAHTGTVARDRAVHGTPGSFSMTGLAAAPHRSRGLTLVGGSFAVVGDGATSHPVLKLSLAPGAFARSGLAATLARRQPGSTVTPGAFALSGVAATLKRGTRGLHLAPGAFDVTAFLAGIVDSGDYGGLINQPRWLSISSISLSDASAGIDQVVGEVLLEPAE